MSGRKPPCRFYQQGNCKNGSRCPFPHVIDNNNNDNNNNRWNPANSSSTNRDISKFWDDRNLDSKEKEIKEAVLAYSEMQIVPVTSSFGLGNPGLVNVIDGRDYSSDESRWDFYQARQNGTVSDYEKMLQIRKQDMDQCVEYLRQNSQKAARYTQIVTKSKYNDPSAGDPKPFIPQALDLNGSSQQQVASPFGNTNPFGSSTDTSSNPFGSQAAGGNPFGSPAFGSTQNATSGGAFGTQTKPAFGSAGLGASLTATNPVASSAFGSSALSSTSPFVSMATSNNSNGAFGSLGQSKPAFGSSAFGNSGLGASTSSNTTMKSQAAPGFGSSSFGNSTIGSTNNTSSAFGSSGFTNAPSTSAPSFGSSSFGSKPTTSPFGSVQQSNVSPFGGANTQQTNTSPFGGAQSQQTNSSPFGSASAKPTSSPFGNVAQHTETNSFGFSQPFGNSSIEFQPKLIQSGKEPARVQEKDLSDEIVEQFKADKFTLGKVPEIPPPLAFC